MTELATQNDHTKEQLPGYTGHVPSKNERFGVTAGKIEREILANSGKNPNIIDFLKTTDDLKSLNGRTSVLPLKDWISEQN